MHGYAMRMLPRTGNSHDAFASGQIKEGRGKRKAGIEIMSGVLIDVSDGRMDRGRDEGPAEYSGPPRPQV